MPISRRALFRRLSAGAAITMTAPDLRGLAHATRDGAAATTTRNGKPIRLNRNENAYGPSHTVIAAIRQTTLTAASRFPDSEAEALRRKIAAFHRVVPEQVVLGCGSSELLRIAIDAFAGAHKKLVVAVPVFQPIAEWAVRAGATLVGVPVRRDYSHDLDGMLARIEATTSLVYICNPHNPTGRLTSRADLDAFLRKLPSGIVVVIDEAYHHYAGESADYVSFIDKPFDSDAPRVAQGKPFDSGAPRVAQAAPFDSRVIVTRSFSKIHGLAGLRVGYAVAPAPLARVLASHTLSDGVSVVAAGAAAAALDDTDHVRTSLARNSDDRQEFFNQATARMIRSDSVTNFVMLDTGRSAAEVVEHFRQHDILVAGPIEGFDQGICVSLGTPADMRDFWRVWDLIVGHKMPM
jgi:histidinol-phosphate aminotransferase